MENVLIPLGLLLVMGLLVAVLMRAARSHKKEMTNAFEEFSIRHGLRYQADDDGRVQEFARDLDGIGQFDSPSQGRVIPNDVVSGTVDGLRIFLFRHSTRDSEDREREWFVAGLEAREPIADRCSVQFCRKGTDSDTTYLPDPVVKQKEFGSFEVVVRAPDSASAGELCDEQLLERLAGLAGELSLRPEIQVRERRVVAYPADRDTTINHVETLNSLLAFSRKTAGIGR